MSATIHIQILAGPDAGLQKALTDERIAFGRAPENPICVADPNASRLHGELAFHEGHWYVFNRSPNGTTLNGKRIKDGEPIAMKPGDIVGVGKTKLLSVHFTPQAAAKAPVEEVPAVGRKKMSARTKLWTGIGVYAGAMLIVGLWLMSAGAGGGKELKAVLPLTDQQIDQEIRKPAVVSVKDDREATLQIEEARQLFSRRTMKPGALYETYSHYKLALAHSGKRSFDGLDQIQFVEVEAELIARTTTNYRDAYNKVNSGQWANAEKALRDILKQYPDERSEIYRNTGQQLDFVMAHTAKKKGFF